MEKDLASAHFSRKSFQKIQNILEQKHQINITLYAPLGFKFNYAIIAQPIDPFDNFLVDGYFMLYSSCTSPSIINIYPLRFIADMLRVIYPFYVKNFLFVVVL